MFCSPGFPLPPFPPGPGLPPMQPPGFVPHPGMPPPSAPTMAAAPPPPRFVPAQNAQTSAASPSAHSEQIQPSSSEMQRPEVRVRQPVLSLPDPSRSQTNPDFKKATDLKFKDANFSPVRQMPPYHLWVLSKFSNRTNIGPYTPNIFAQK
jgi:hypothetical protein